MNDEIDKVFNKHIEKYSSMSEDEIKNYLSKSPMRKYERLNYAYVRVDLLLDYIKVIKEHKKELQSPGNKVLVSSGHKFNPTSLYEYIILEITSFYDLLKGIKKKERLDELPDLPPYWTAIRDFRNQITAHLDKKGKFKTTAEWMEQYAKVDKIGTTKIVNQFKKDYYKTLKILEGDM